jgi:hypothetical protein
VVTGFLKLTWWQMPLAVIGVLLAVSGPSAIIAWLKLRQRNVGPLLDACGWAVNGRMKINIPFGAALTSIAKLPKGAQRRLEDPYTEVDPARRIAWILITIFAIATVGALIWNKVNSSLDVSRPKRSAPAAISTNKPPATTNQVGPEAR